MPVDNEGMKPLKKQASKFRELDDPNSPLPTIGSIKKAASQLVKQTMADLGIDGFQTTEQINRGTFEVLRNQGFSEDQAIETIKSTWPNTLKILQEKFDLAPDPTKPGGMNKRPSGMRKAVLG